MSQPQRNGGASRPSNRAESHANPRSSSPRPAAETDGQPDDKLAQVNLKVEGVKKTLQRNIELAIDRGEKIDEIADKSEILVTDAEKFRDSARNVRGMFCRRYYRMIGIIAAIVIVIILVIVLISYLKN